MLPSGTSCKMFSGSDRARSYFTRSGQSHRYESNHCTVFELILKWLCFLKNNEWLMHSKALLKLVAVSYVNLLFCRAVNSSSDSFNSIDSVLRSLW